MINLKDEYFSPYKATTRFILE